MKKLLLILISIIPLFAKLNVAISIPPQEYILEQIAPNLVNATLLVKPGNSPHTYEPKASQMVNLSKAKLYFAIGVEFEKAWLNRFKSQNPNLKIIHTDANISKIPIAFGQEKGELDPHIWLAPKNIKTIAINMANALIEYDSNNTKAYKYNLKKFLNRVDSLDKEIKTKLSNLKNRNFLVFHPSWGYFAKEYNLNQIAIEISGKEPSAKDLIKIIKLAKAKNIKVIFVQPEFSTKSANLIAKELNIAVVKISPLQKNIIKNLTKFTNALVGNYEK